jgi:leucyl aminopeptidase
MKIGIAKKYELSDDLVLLCNKESDLKEIGLNEDETKFIKERFKNEDKEIELNRLSNSIFILVKDQEAEKNTAKDKARKSAFGTCKKLNSLKKKKVTIVNLIDDNEFAYAYAEGLALSNYQFNKYFTGKNKKDNSLKEIKIISKGFAQKDSDNLNAVIEAVYFARDLVNEPQSFLTATQLSEEIKAKSKEAGYSVKVMDKKAIQKEKMGGLLAVNKGSVEPPTFNIIEWKPKDAKNKKPFLLVGKGVVYDTGGLSLKPTGNSMDFMKSDMGGAAAVAGAMYAIAKSELPIHVIGLIPATDNRPDGEAYAPGDVITMHNGMTVEVLNTDAEGRMILADAHSYGQQYDPELVIDLATLTGAASRAVGDLAVVAMGNADKKWIYDLDISGNDTYERIAWMPFWDEYFEKMKSDIADMKNIGGAEAGAITAGKFLEKFTKHPYIHIDIAGSAFLKSGSDYRGKGATGVGVRLIYDFFHKLVK